MMEMEGGWVDMGRLMRGGEEGEGRLYCGRAPGPRFERTMGILGGFASAIIKTVESCLVGWGG